MKCVRKYYSSANKESPKQISSFLNKYCSENLFNFENALQKNDSIFYPLALLKVSDYLNKSEFSNQIAKNIKLRMRNDKLLPSYDIPSLVELLRTLELHNLQIDSEVEKLDLLAQKDAWKWSRRDFSPESLSWLENRKIFIDQIRMKKFIGKKFDKEEISFDGSKISVKFLMEESVEIKHLDKKITLFLFDWKGETLAHHQTILFNSRNQLSNFGFILDLQEYNLNDKRIYQLKDLPLFQKAFAKNGFIFDDENLLVRKENEPLYIESIINMFSIRSEVEFKLIASNIADIKHELSKNDQNSEEDLIKFQKQLTDFIFFALFKEIITAEENKSDYQQFKFWKKNCLRSFVHSSLFSDKYRRLVSKEMLRLLKYSNSIGSKKPIAVFIPKDQIDVYLTSLIDLMKTDIQYDYKENNTCAENNTELDKLARLLHNVCKPNIYDLDETLSIIH